MNSIKTITYQRVIQFFRAKKAVDIYSKITNSSYEFRDVLGGSQHWCDFDNGVSWGEYTSLFQNDEEAKYIHQQLYHIDIQKLIEDYKVEIDVNSIPPLGKTVFFGIPLYLTIRRKWKMLYLQFHPTFLQERGIAFIEKEIA